MVTEMGSSRATGRSGRPAARHVWVWVVVCLAIAGLAVLFFVQRRGGELQLAGGVTAFTQPTSFGNGDGGLPVEGVLTIVDGGCLAVKNPDGSSAFLGLPAGTRVDDSGSAVVTGKSRSTGDEQAYKVGDTIKGSGGDFSAGSWRDIVRSYWPDVSAQCLDSVSGYIALTDTSGS